MKKNLLKTMALVLVLALAPSMFPIKSSAVTVSAGGIGYTSVKSFTSGTHSTYYCKLSTVTFDGLPTNSIPTGKYVYARIRTYESGGSVKKRAGALAAFSKVGNGYYYSYNSGYGKPGSYVLATNSNYNKSYTCSFNWKP